MKHRCYAPTNWKLIKHELDVSGLKVRIIIPRRHQANYADRTPVTALS